MGPFFSFSLGFLIPDLAPSIGATSGARLGGSGARGVGADLVVSLGGGDGGTAWPGGVQSLGSD